MRTVTISVMFCVLLSFFTTNSVAEGPATQPADPSARVTTRPAGGRHDKDANDGEHLSVTHHSITLKGATLGYTATAGTLPQKDETGKAKADMFFVAYTKDAPAATQTATRPAARASTRPITFIFNGGPGSASVWLHLGAAGPK